MVKSNNDFDILIERCKSGDNAAFDEIYRRCYSNVAFVCSKLCDNKEDVEEIVQDTFVALFRKVDTLKVDTLIPYLRKIAANNCYKKYRDSKKHKNNIADEDYDDTMLAELDQDFLPEKYLESRESQVELLKIINSLPPQQKKMIYLYYYADINTEEIAKLNNCSSANVRKILYTARNTIKSKMESEAPESKFKYAANAALAGLLFAEEQNFVISHVAADIAAVSGIAATTANTSVAGGILTAAASVAVVCVVSVAVYFAYTSSHEPEIVEPAVVEISQAVEMPYPEYEIFIYEEIPMEVVDKETEEAIIEETYEPVMEQLPITAEDIHIQVDEPVVQVEQPIEEYQPDVIDEELYEPPPIPIDRTTEILAALAIATTPEEVAKIIDYYGFLRSSQMRRVTGEWFLFYVLDEGSGDILVGIAEHETDNSWHMKFEHYANGHKPSDILDLFYWMEG